MASSHLYGANVNDHVTIKFTIGHFLLVVLWNQAYIYLQPFSRYWVLSVLKSEFDLWGSCDVIGHVNFWFPIDIFPLVVLWNH